MIEFIVQTLCCGSERDANGQYCCNEAFSDAETEFEIVKSHRRNVRSASRTRAKSSRGIKKIEPGKFFNTLLENGKRSFKDGFGNVANLGQVLLETFMEFLENTNPELGQKISHQIQQAIDILTNSKIKLGILAILKPRDVLNRYHRIREKFEGGVDSVATILETILEEFCGFLESNYRELANQIKVPMDEAISILKLEESEQRAKSFATVQVPNLKTMGTLLFVLSSLCRFLYH